MSKRASLYIYNARLSNGAIGAVGPNATVNIHNRGNGSYRRTRPSSRMFHTSRGRARHVTGKDQLLEEIPYSVEGSIVEMLDSPSPLGNDFKALAGHCGLTILQINHLTENGKTTSLLQHLCEQRKTVGYLVDQLKKMDRKDIIEVIGLKEDNPTSSGEVEERTSNHVFPAEGDDGQMERRPSPLVREETGNSNEKCPTPPREEVGDSKNKHLPPLTEEAGDSNEECPPTPTEEAGDSNEKCSPTLTEEAGDSNGMHSPPPTEEEGDSVGRRSPPPTKKADDSNAAKQPLLEESAGAVLTERFTREPKEVSLDSNTETGSRPCTNTSQDSWSSSAYNRVSYMARYCTDGITRRIMSLKLVDSDVDSDCEDGPMF